MGTEDDPDGLNIQTMEDLYQGNIKLKDKLELLQGEYDEALADVEYWQDEHSKLEYIIGERDETLEEKAGQIEDLEKEVEDLKKEIKELNSTIADLGFELDEAKRELAQERLKEI